MLNMVKVGVIFLSLQFFFVPLHQRKIELYDNKRRSKKNRERVKTY